MCEKYHDHKIRTQIRAGGEEIEPSVPVRK